MLRGGLPFLAQFVEKARQTVARGGRMAVFMAEIQIIAQPFQRRRFAGCGEGLLPQGGEILLLYFGRHGQHRNENSCCGCFFLDTDFIKRVYVLCCYQYPRRRA